MIDEFQLPRAFGTAFQQNVKIQQFKTERDRLRVDRARAWRDNRILEDEKNLLGRCLRVAAHLGFKDGEMSFSREIIRPHSEIVTRIADDPISQRVIVKWFLK